MAIALLSITGCGYSTKQVFPDHVQTVAVPIFGNRTFYREMEVQLTEAIAKEIERRTPYKVVPRSEADTVLEGTILGVTQRRLSRTNTGNLPQEVELRVTIDFQWKMLNSGEVLRDRKGFETVARYIPSRPISEPLALGLRVASQRIADDVVSELRADW